MCSSALTVHHHARVIVGPSPPHRIDEPHRRQAFLATLGGIEETAVIELAGETAGETIIGQPEADLDRTTAAGKASSVQFIHFPFTDDQVARFRQGETQVLVGFRPQSYGHMAVLPETHRAVLAADFD